MGTLEERLADMKAHLLEGTVFLPGAFRHYQVTVTKETRRLCQWHAAMFFKGL